MAVSYHQEGEINKCWLPPAIKPKIGDKRQRKKDGEQINIEVLQCSEEETKCL